MGTKTYNNYEDLLTFTRASGGHALRPVSYGSELVTNGDFSTDSDWTKEAAWTISNGVASFDDSVNANLQQANIGMEVGKIYQFKFEITAGADANFSLFASGSNEQYIGYTDYAVGTHSVNFICTGGDGVRLAASKFVGSSFSIDNISVKEVTFDESDGTLTLFEHPNNIPRVEYDADGNRLGLLVEEARTNLIYQSEDFTDSNWFSSEMLAFGSGSTSNAIAAPNGTITADLIVPSTTSSNLHWIRHAVAGQTVGNDYTISVYVKAAGYTTCSLRMVGTNAPITNFDLSAETANQSSATITNVGNGWYRCTLTGEATASTVWHYIYPNQQATFAGDGTSGIYIWGAQLEAGSFPTSYIKTTGSTATRSADVASIDTDDFGYNKAEGTVVCEFNINYEDGGSGFPRVWEIGNNSSSADRINIYIAEGNGNLAGGVNTNGVGVGGTLKTNTGGSVQSNVALGWARNDFGMTDDGDSVIAYSDIDILPTANPRNVFKIGGAANSGTDNISGHIKSIKYYPRKLTNAQLQDLTS